jgi:hypothetical protein
LTCGYGITIALAIDLGKFKSVICVLNVATGEATFRTVTTTPDVPRMMVEQTLSTR